MARALPWGAGHGHGAPMGCMAWLLWPQGPHGVHGTARVSPRHRKVRAQPRDVRVSRGGPSWDLHPRDFHPNNVAWFRVCCPAAGQGDTGTQGHRDAGTRAVPAAAGRRGTAPVQPHAGHEQHCSPAAPRPRPGPRTQPLAAASLCAKPGPGKWGWGCGDVGTWGHGDTVPVLPLLAPHSPAQGSAQARGMQHAFSSARFARQKNCRFRSARIARRPKIIGGKNAKKKNQHTPFQWFLALKQCRA